MAYTEFYCQTTGNNLNSGSTTSNTATYTGTGDSDGTSVFTPNDGSTPASSVSVGDFASVYVSAGATTTVFVGRVTVVAAGVNGAITCSTTAKSGTFPSSSGGAHTITCKVGGAWQGPNGTVGFPFNFVVGTQTNSSGDYPRVNFLNGTNYAITAAMTHTLNGPIVFQGYTTTVGDGGRAIIDGGTSGASYALLTISGGNNNVLRDFIFQNNGSTGSVEGLNLNQTVCERITVNSVRGNGILINGQSALLIECEAYSCNQSNTSVLAGIKVSNSNSTMVRCISHDNAGSNSSGFSLASGGSLINCIADTNGQYGFNAAVGGAGAANSIERCVAYNNTSHGFTVTGANSRYILNNCIFANNGGFGVNSSTSSFTRLSNCGFFSNTSGQTNSTVDATGTITFGAQPMTDPANGDFSLQTAGGGSLAKNSGRGNFMQNSGSYSRTTISYPDLGAAQHQERRVLRYRKGTP